MTYTEQQKKDLDIYVDIDTQLKRADKRAKFYKMKLDKERLAHKETLKQLEELKSQLNGLKQPELKDIREQKWESAPSITSRALRQYCQQRWGLPCLKWCNSPETGKYDKDLKNSRMKMAKEILLKKN